MQYKLIEVKQSFNKYCLVYDIDGEIYFYYPKYGYLATVEEDFNFDDAVYNVLYNLKSRDITQEVNLIAVVLTPNCLCNCLYCYADGVKNKNVKVNYEGITKFIQNNKSAKILQFFGGEPLLELDYIKSVGFDGVVEIVTGLGISDIKFNEYLDLAKKSNVHTTVSIDACDENGNYHTRIQKGINSNQLFRNILNKVKLLNDAGVNYSLRATLTNVGYRLDKYLNDIEDFIGEEVPWGFGVVHGERHDIFKMSIKQVKFVENFLYENILKIINGERVYIPNPISSYMNLFYEKLVGGLLYNSLGICNFGGRGGMTINWSGQVCLCPEEAVRSNMPLNMIHKKCYDCDFLMSCGSLCLFNKPEDNEMWCWLYKTVIINAVPLAILKHKKELNLRGSNGVC